MDKEQENSRKLNWKKLVPIILVIAVSGSVVAHLIYRNSEEQKARRVVEAHLETIKSGVGNPYETVDIVNVQEVFINVLDYKYLGIARKEKVPDEPMVFDKREYDEVYSKIYKSYDEYLDETMKLYGERATMDRDRIVVRRDTYHYELGLVYDLVITNKLGQQLYKKYVFEVKPTSIGKYGYKITALHER